MNAPHCATCPMDADNVPAPACAHTALDAIDTFTIEDMDRAYATGVEAGIYKARQTVRRQAEAMDEALYLLSRSPLDA